MLLVLVALFVAASFFLVCVKREKQYLLLNLMCVSLADFVFWLMVYIAKKGGISPAMSTVFYLTRGVRNALQYLQVLLSTMSYGAALGRYLFPTFFLLFALGTVGNMEKKTRTLLSCAVLPLPVMYLVLYIPKVFEALRQKGPFWSDFLIQGSRIFVWTYTILALVLLVSAFVQTKNHFFRMRFVQCYAVVPAMAIIYLLYCEQDPGQIYLFYRDEYMMSLGLWYLNNAMSAFPVQIGVLLVTLGLGVISFWFLGRITLHSLAESRQKEELHKKSEIARVGGSIFVHSIKNQILAALVYDKRIKAQLAEETPDLSELRRQADELHVAHQKMLEHMNALYKIISEKHVTMTLLPLGEWLDAFAREVKDKLPFAHVYMEREREVDASYVKMHTESMTEALLNLVQNGYEANCAAGRSDRAVIVRFKRQQGDVLIEVADAGNGMSRSAMRRLFEPFFTEKNTNDNWGMGLYYTRKVVRRHGGEVYAESHPGKGMQFYIVLPCARKKQNRRISDE